MGRLDPDLLMVGLGMNIRSLFSDNRQAWLGGLHCPAPVITIMNMNRSCQIEGHLANRIYVEVTNRCNLSCRDCWLPDDYLQDSMGYEHPTWGGCLGAKGLIQ